LCLKGAAHSRMLDRWDNTHLAFEISPASDSTFTNSAEIQKWVYKSTKNRMNSIRFMVKY